MNDLAGRLAAARAGDRVAKVAYPIEIRTLEVLRVQSLTASMIRLVLGGDGIVGFQSHVPEEHIRLVFPDADGSMRLPDREGDRLRWPRPLPPSREYTVRQFDSATGELVVDFALHDGGLASDWARTVAVGTSIAVAGPPGGVVIPDGVTHHLFAGDLTALPQIARYLEALAPDARGWAFIDIRDSAEEIDLAAPAGVEVTWVHRGDAAPGDGAALDAAVRSVSPPPEGRTFVWIAGEAGAIRGLRRWVGEVGIAAGHSRITGYWKRGVADYDD